MEWDTAFHGIQNRGHFGRSCLGAQSTPPLPLFLISWMLLQLQTHQCPMRGKDHFHRHAGSSTASTAQGAGLPLLLTWFILNWVLWTFSAELFPSSSPPPCVPSCHPKAKGFTPCLCRASFSATPSAFPPHLEKGSQVT